MRTLDPGTMGGDEGSPGFLLGMLTVTLFGIFIISALIGIINTGLEGKLAELRKGRSRVVESGHTVILGWSQEVYTVVSELVTANANQPKSAIVILADRDKGEMDDDIRARLPHTGKTSIICRTGTPMDIDDLEIARLETSRAIVILSPETDDPDADVIKTMLAVTNHPRRRPEPYHIVAELHDADEPRRRPPRRRRRGPAHRVRRPDRPDHRPDLPPGRPVDGLHGAARLRRRRDLLRDPARARRADIRRRAARVRGLRAHRPPARRRHVRD